MKTLVSKNAIRRAAQTILSLAISIFAAQVAAAQATNTLNSTGNAGVGTTSPESILTVQTTGTDSGGDKYLRIKSTNSFAGLLLDPNQSGDAKWLLLGGYPNVGDFTIREFNVGNYFTIKKTTGYIGIGTSSPSRPLEVSAADGEAVRLYRNANSSGWGVNLKFSFNNSSDGQVDYAGLHGVIENNTAGNHGGSLIFTTATNGSLSEKLRITSSGNVGIGTTSPLGTLHTKGQFLFFDDSSGSISGGIYANSLSSNPFTLWSGAGDFRIGTGVTDRTVGAGFAERIRILNSNGNVGIGTTSPSDPLQIDSTAGWGLRIRYTGNGQYLRLSGNQMSSFTSAGAGADLYLNSAGGNVGIGTTTPGSTYKLDVAGNINSSGTITGNNIVAKYQDVAEWVPSTQQLEAGTVVVLDTNKSNEVIASTQAYDTRVAGVVSAQPGITLGEKSDSKVLVATTGRVRVKVDATKSPIQIGDLLVTSDVPGVAMKSEAVNLGGVQIHRPGTIIGKALEPLAKGSGEILVLLSLQ